MRLLHADNISTCVFLLRPLYKHNIIHVHFMITVQVQLLHVHYTLLEVTCYPPSSLPTSALPVLSLSLATSQTITGRQFVYRRSVHTAPIQEYNTPARNFESTLCMTLYIVPASCILCRGTRWRGSQFPVTHDKYSTSSPPLTTFLPHHLQPSPFLSQSTGSCWLV